MVEFAFLLVRKIETIQNIPLIKSILKSFILPLITFAISSGRSNIFCYSYRNFFFKYIVCELLLFLLVQKRLFGIKIYVSPLIESNFSF